MLIRDVARAICMSRTCEGVSCCQWPSQRGRTDCPVNRGYYDEAARAAIEAMRDVPDRCYDDYRCVWRDLNSKEVWNLWIDAALTPKVAA